MTVPDPVRVDPRAGGSGAGEAETVARSPGDGADARTRPVFSLVIPVYGNEATIPALLEAIDGIASRAAGPFEAVFVVDGSPDRSGALLEELLPGQSYRSVVLHLSRNFGSFGAIRTGMEVAEGAYVAVMAADLQEPPELVDQFFRILAADEADVAVGERTGRADPAASRIGSSWFWRLYRRFVQPDMPAGGVDVFACNDAARRALLGMREANSSLVGLLIWMGFRRQGVPYERRPRPSGRSGWTLTRKLRYMADSLFSFTDLPIRLLLIAGVGGTLAALAATVVVLVAWLVGEVEVPGYTPLMLAVLIVGGLVISALGIIGSYVWRTYENTKHRPLTLVRTTERFPGQGGGR